MKRLGVKVLCAFTLLLISLVANAQIYSFKGLSINIPNDFALVSKNSKKIQIQNSRSAVMSVMNFQKNNGTYIFSVMKFKGASAKKITGRDLDQFIAGLVMGMLRRGGFQPSENYKYKIASMIKTQTIGHKKFHVYKFHNNDIEIAIYAIATKNNSIVGFHFYGANSDRNRLNYMESRIEKSIATFRPNVKVRAVRGHLYEVKRKTLNK